MFGKNSYMFPHGSPSYHPRTSEIPLHHHHHHDMFPGYYLASASAAGFSDVGGGLNGGPSAINTTIKANSKKDRHSKIYTSQGPRDRRVRLSIGVARKFFDLQEILGFDKPSKTLDWLLTKSKAAIKDLVQTKEKGSTDAAKSGSSAAPSECEVDSGEANFENGMDLKRKLVVSNNSDKLKGAAKESTTNLAKESRVKARARARERTREKMCIKKFNETRNNDGGGGGGGGYDLSPTFPIQFMNKINSGSSSSNINLGFHCHPNYEAAANDDLVHESIVIKRKVKHPASILGFQQNLIISSSGYGVVPSPYNGAAAENWDICAILDQHKFINRKGHVILKSTGS